MYTAKYLEKALGRRDDFEIVLVNKENYFVFQPMLPEVISGSIGLLDTVSPIRRLLPRTNLHVREVESIDIKNMTITTSPGFRHTLSLPKREFSMLAAYLPQMRETLENVMEQRTRSNAQKMAGR